MGYELQKSFSGGEISPLMHLRNDEDVFSQSVALMLNMILLLKAQQVAAGVLNS